MKRLHSLCLLLLLCLTAATLQAAELRVAVAANFLGSMQQLAARFEAETGHSITLSSGSSGAFYTQIVNGAPFDVFFSADSRRPETLVNDGLARADSLFTYAIGVPVLWSATPGFVDDQGQVLTSGDFRFLALANPDNAPYGYAGQQVLQRLGLWDKLNEEQKIVRAQSIGQAHSQVASGAAELGFVALAQIMHPDFAGKGSYWTPPSDYYDPIVQKAVILNTAQDLELARNFMDFIRSAPSAVIIRAAGYSLED